MERKIRKLKRFAEGTLDPNTAKAYRKKVRQAQHELKLFVEEHNDDLHREYSREKVYGGVDKSAESGIIKASHNLAEKKKFSFDDYDNVINLNSVDRFKKTAKKLGYEYINGAEKLTDGRIARKILNDVNKLSKQYGKRFSSISIMNFENEKTIAETMLGKLRLNSKFMNKPDAIREVLNQWERDNFIPKGCNTIQYVSKHEYYHLLTQDAIAKEKSQIMTEIRRLQLPPVSGNAKKDAHEYVADLLAATKLTLKQQKLKNKILKIIEKG